MKESIKKWIIFWLTSVLTMLIAWLAYAASVWTVTTGQTLTADMWNNMTWNYNYSLSEVNTWKKWIDWKPIYRKVVDMGVMTNDEEKIIAHNISNLSRLVFSDFIFLDNTWNHFTSAYSVYVSSVNRRLLLVNNTSVDFTIEGTARANVYIVLEYTKTTD